MIGLKKPERGCRLNPVQQLRIVGGVCFAAGRLAPHAVMHASHARNHRFGDAAGSVYGHHGRKPSAAKTAERIFAKSAVLPHTGPHPGFGKLEDNGRYTANVCGDRVLEDAPGYRRGRSKRRLSRRAAEIDSPSPIGQKQLPRRPIEPADDGPLKGK